MTPQTTTDTKTDGSTDRLASATGDEIPLDIMFEILKNSRRRMVLDYLKAHDDQVKLSDLADVVTAQENDTDVASITSTERKRVYVGLYQFHLPKMDDMGIIEFDQDRGTIRLADRGRKLLKAHERTNTPARKWHYLYLSVATVGLFAAGASLSVHSATVPAAVLALQSLVLGVIAIVHAAEFHDSLPGIVRIPRLRVHERLPILGW